MSTAPRTPGGAPSPVGTIALFYQWYNYEEIRRALAPSYFTDNGISGYSWRFTPTKDCTIQFNILKSYSSGWWLTFYGGDYSSTGITNGMTRELKKGAVCDWLRPQQFRERQSEYDDHREFCEVRVAK